MDIEAQKCINEETQRFLNELIKEQNQVENELKGYANQLEKLRFLAGKKQRDVDVLSTKIESAMNKTGVSRFEYFFTSIAFINCTFLRASKYHLKK